MRPRDWACRVGVWILFAAVVVWPVSIQPFSRLVGDPDVDVWNHAWGYWFVANELSDFRLPFATQLIGAPDGGVIYFIDMLGALMGAPLTWILGPAFAYNAVVVLRVALAGLGVQTLTEALTRRGAHSYLAGVAYAGSPFLLCEMSNGISEVFALHWIPWALLAVHAVVEKGGRGRWLILGVVVGFSAIANFYYGLIAGLLVGARVAWAWTQRWRAGQPLGVRLMDVVSAIGVGTILALPCWLLFHFSIGDEASLVVRTSGHDSAWMDLHNAVDLRIFFWPGDFQSVDLFAYGERFRHTGYLRWSVLALAGLALIRRPKLRVWGVIGLLSLVLGLGSYLVCNGWVMPGGYRVPLPFSAMRIVLPDLVISHPLRLSVGGQALFAVLAGAGLAELSSAGRAWLAHPLAVFALSILVFAEGAFGSAAVWPIPSADAEVPELYSGVWQGPVLDLPASVGATMATSRYFWYQTEHGRPIPYSPNARLASCRDPEVQGLFSDPVVRRQENRIVEHPSAGPPKGLGRLPETYAAIVVHRDLQKRSKLPADYTDVLELRFGPPIVIGDHHVWRFPQTVEMP